MKIFGGMIKQKIVKADFVFCRLRQKVGGYFCAAKLKILAQCIHGLLEIVTRPSIRIED